MLELLQIRQRDEGVQALRDSLPTEMRNAVREVLYYETPRSGPHYGKPVYSLTIAPELKFLAIAALPENAREVYLTLDPQAPDAISHLDLERE